MFIASFFLVFLKNGDDLRWLQPLVGFLNYHVFSSMSMKKCKVVVIVLFLV